MQRPVFKRTVYCCCKALWAALGNCAIKKKWFDDDDDGDNDDDDDESGRNLPHDYSWFFLLSGNVSHYIFWRFCSVGINQSFAPLLRVGHRMAKCCSACNGDTSLQWAGCLPSIERNSFKMSKISTMVVDHKISELTLHYTQSEIVGHLSVVKILHVLHSLLLRAAYLSRLSVPPTKTVQSWAKLGMVR